MRSGSIHDAPNESVKPNPGWKSPYVWAYLPAALLAIVGPVAISIKKWQTGDPFHNAGVVGGAIFAGGVLIAAYYLIGLLFALIARRSRLVLSIFIALLCTVSTLGNSFTVYRAIRKTPSAVHQATYSQFLKLSNDFEAASRKRAEAGDASPSPEAMLQYAADLRDLSTNYKGSDGDYLKGLAALNEAKAKNWAEYNSSLEQFLLTSPLETGRIKSLEDLELSRRDIERFRSASKEVARSNTNPRAWVREVLLQEGIDSPASEHSVVKAMQSDPEMLNIQRQTFELDYEFLDLLLEVCDLLENYWGGWKNVDDTIMFDDSAALESWNNYTVEIEEIGANQFILNAEYIQLLTK